MNSRIALVEVGPRDGLQNERKIIPAAAKIDLVNELAACGLSRIEVTGFVSPRWVPQLSDASEVMAGITRKAHVTYSALIPNVQGLKRARASGADEVAVFTSASESFCRRNINCSIDESMERFRPVLAAATDAAIPVRGYVSCVTDCPYEGAVAPGQVARVSQDLLDLGCREISLGDTIGIGTPEKVAAMLSVVMKRAPATRLAGHFHDTAGRALENIKVCLKAGLRVFDTAVAGLGGGPFAPGAEGNVATESVCEMLLDAGYETGIDLARLKAVAVPLARSMRGSQ